MKTIILTPLIIFLAAISIIAQNSNQSKTRNNSSDALAEARSAIDKGNAQWADAWTKGDAAAVADLFAEDGKFLSSSGKIYKGHEQILNLYKNAMKGIGTDIKGMKVTVETVNVWLDGDMAFETGKYSYNYEENGKPTVEAGKYVTIWKKQKDGSWKLFMDMGVPQN